MEQCWRDALKIVWGLKDDPDEFNRRVPSNKPITITMICCQQFLMSREMVRRRPLSVWKDLLQLTAQSPVCHSGEPDYANLYAYHKSINTSIVGPELPHIVSAGDTVGLGFGRHTQGGTTEHLSHVIFGFHDLIMPSPDINTQCQNFLPNCPFSPCKRN
jgi:hypothetical protein